MEDSTSTLSKSERFSSGGLFAVDFAGIRLLEGLAILVRFDVLIRWYVS